MDTSWSETRAERWGLLVEEVRRRVGPGTRLTPSTRRFFEGQLGADLGEVLVHRGPFAGYLAGGLRAEAATAGTHVFGGDSRLDEDTREGMALLGHEVVHASEARPEYAPPSPDVTVTEAPIQRAPLDGGAEDGDEEERFAQSMETVVADMVSELETEPPEDAPARRAPVDTGVLAERVYQRIVDAARLERERGAW